MSRSTSPYESLEGSRKRLLSRYRFVDLAHKVVGVGSVGTRCFISFWIGIDDGDPLFLQVKEARTSLLEPYLGRSEYDHPGQRIVTGQRLMQAVGDILLGWYSVTGFDGRPYDFYVRQLWDGKGSFNVAAMTEDAWHTYAEMCSWVLARAHARSGDRIAITAYMGADGLHASGFMAVFVFGRDGGGTPIKTFQTTAALGSGGGSATAVRTPDA